MIPMKRVGLLAGAATLTLSGGSFADTGLEAQNDELRARISELESRLGAVEAQNSDSWLTEQRAEEIKGLVQDVLADADTRSSLLSQGMTAGYDDGAVIASADGNWLLRTNIFLQTRFMLTNANNTSVTSPIDQNSVWGFEVTRAKFVLSGNVVSPDWFYKISVDIGSNLTTLVDATGTLANTRSGLGYGYIGYDYGNGWRVMLGSMKAPFMREELVDPWNQLTVERSLYNYVFTGGYTAGIAVDWMNDQFHVTGMYHNGVQNLIYTNAVAAPGPVTGGAGPALVADTDVAFSARGEWLAMGTWDQFTDMTSPQGEEQGLLVGVGFNLQTPQVPGSDDTLVMAITIDASWEMGGANVFTSFNWGKGDNTGGAGTAADADVTPWGFMIQGGYYLTEDWEAFLRYEYADVDQFVDIGNINIATIGVNKYFAGNHAKWSTDAGFAMDSVPVSSPVTGWRADNNQGMGQFVFRSQLSILF